MIGKTTGLRKSFPFQGSGEGECLRTMGRSGVVEARAPARTNVTPRLTPLRAKNSLLSIQCWTLSSGHRTGRPCPSQPWQSPRSPLGAVEKLPRYVDAVARSRSSNADHSILTQCRKNATFLEPHCHRPESSLFREEDGTVPLLTWLDTLPEKARDKCVTRIEPLAELGYELRRPEADYIGRNIYELRVRHLGIRYRLLYFFHGDQAAVITHGFTKNQSSVPTRQIEVAIKRRAWFLSNPEKHTHQEG